MRTAAVLSFLAPALAYAYAHDSQILFDSPAPRRIPASRPIPTRAAHRANPSVVVHVVDPARPSTSSVVMAQSMGWYPAEDELDQVQDDAPNFGRQCSYDEPFKTCGDFFDEVSGVDHGLFCSPAGVCGGKGAACGATEACGDGLSCNLATHRCVQTTAKLLSIESARKASRRQAAASRCPDGAQACPSGIGGFECVYTAHEDTECGGCLGMGGRNCAAIPNALATSCRGGGCVVHACVGGYQPNEEGTDCVDDMFSS
ncbi:hypothetical protein JCM10449v2_001149 [Rhodotorula kratochvilovae]